KRLRGQLRSALRHGARARSRARSVRGRSFAASAKRLATDRALRAELKKTRNDLRRARARLEKSNRPHRLRKLTLLGAGASLAVPQVRQRVASLVRTAPLPTE